MKNYSVFIGESYTPQIVKTLNFVLAQPTCGKTTFAKSSKHNDYIIDLDDILHVVKKTYDMSGWDMLNTICFDCIMDDDIQTLRDADDEIKEKIILFTDILSKVIKACIAVGTDRSSRTHESSITLLSHHHSMTIWSYLAYLSVKEELPSFNPEVKLFCFQRTTSDDYILEWKKRQESENSKNRSFDDDSLRDVYFTWCQQSNITYLAKLLDISASNIYYETLPADQYLSGYFNAKKADSYDKWDRDTDVHRYQVMALWNLMQQKAMTDVLKHDIDKYHGFDGLRDWLETGFNDHISRNCWDTPSSMHHRQNISQIYTFPEMLCDWMSASKRGKDEPWRKDTFKDDIHLSDYPYDMITLFENSIKEMSDIGWSCIWLISMLIHHDIFDEFYHSNKVNEFPYDILFDFVNI